MPPLLQLIHPHLLPRSRLECQREAIIHEQKEGIRLISAILHQTTINQKGITIAFYNVRMFSNSNQCHNNIYFMYYTDNYKNVEQNLPQIAQIRYSFKLCHPLKYQAIKGILVTECHYVSQVFIIKSRKLKYSAAQDCSVAQWNNLLRGQV